MSARISVVGGAGYGYIGSLMGSSNYRVFWRDDASQTLPRLFSDQTLND